MKTIFLIFLIASLLACNNESDTDTTTKGNTDTTDSIAIQQDSIVKRDTVIPTDTVLGYR